MLSETVGDVLKLNKVFLEATITALIIFLVIFFLSKYINQPLGTAVPIVLASFIGIIVGNLRAHNKRK